MEELSAEQKQELFGGGGIGQVFVENTEDAKEEKKADDNEEPGDTDGASDVDDGVATGSDQSKKEEGGGEEHGSENNEFDLEFFNKQFQQDFKDVESLKKVFDSPQKIKELEDQVEKMKSLEEELSFLREEADPMKYFPSEDDFKVAQFRRQFPDKDPSAVAKLFATDISKMSDFDLLVWAEMLNTPDMEGGEAGARELIADNYGIDDSGNLSDLDSLTRNKMRRDARKERESINKMKEEIQLPEKRDYASLMDEKKKSAEEAKANLNSAWQDISSRVIAEFPDIVINDKDENGETTEYFRYSIGKDLNQEAISDVINGMVELGVPVNEESVRELGREIQKDFISSNLAKIVKAAVKDKLAKEKEATLEEEHNPGKLTDKERPKGSSGDLTSKILSGLREDRYTPKRAI